ncbi:MAG: hypothetical protein JW731_16850 [Bacteroidales bacterium]|nr:hypothetical protein [Bacteroidales bacterium]
MEQDGSFKQFDFVHFRNGYSKNDPELSVDYLEIVVIKQKVGFLKSEKIFEIKLGEKVELQKNTNPRQAVKVRGLIEMKDNFDDPIEGFN